MSVSPLTIIFASLPCPSAQRPDCLCLSLFVRARARVFLHKQNPRAEWIGSEDDWWCGVELTSGLSWPSQTCHRRRSEGFLNSQVGVKGKMKGGGFGSEVVCLLLLLLLFRRRY